MCIKCVFRSDLTSKISSAGPGQKIFRTRTRPGPGQKSIFQTRTRPGPARVRVRFRVRVGPDGLYLLEYLFALQMYVISIVKKFESFAIYPCAQTAM
jgi:hypothetical protein